MKGRKLDLSLTAPSVLWLLFFLLIPVLLLMVDAFLSRGPYGGIVVKWTFENFVRLLDPLYIRIFFSSVSLAVITTMACLFLGFPLAYVMAVSRPSRRWTLLFLLVIPFLTNFVVKAYALKLLLSDHGPVASLLITLFALPNGIDFSNQKISLWLGMLTSYLPFMVFPLYVTLEKMDFTLLEAARDLGARPTQVLLRVLLPLAKKGIWTGAILVFMPALGEFVIPDLLGGARNILYGNLITDQFLKARDWPFGAALAALLLAVVLCGMWIQKRQERA